MTGSQKVVLLACGSYNPPTNMHLRMFGKLARLGYKGDSRTTYENWKYQICRENSDHLYWHCHSHSL